MVSGFILVFLVIETHMYIKEIYGTNFDRMKQWITLTCEFSQNAWSKWHNIKTSSQNQITLACPWDKYPLYLFDKIFCYSYRHKIIDPTAFFLYFNSPFRYFGGVTLMSFNHLSLIFSRVQNLYCMYIYTLFLFRKVLRYPFRPSIY